MTIAELETSLTSGPARSLMPAGSTVQDLLRECCYQCNIREGKPNLAAQIGLEPGEAGRMLAVLRRLQES